MDVGGGAAVADGYGASGPRFGSGRNLGFGGCSKRVPAIAVRAGDRACAVLSFTSPIGVKQHATASLLDEVCYTAPASSETKSKKRRNLAAGRVFEG